MKLSLLLLLSAIVVIAFYSLFTSSYFHDTERVTVKIEIKKPQSAFLKAEKVDNCPFKNVCFKLKNTGEETITITEVEGENLKKLVFFNSTGFILYESNGGKHDLSLKLPPYFDDEDLVYMALKVKKCEKEDKGEESEDKHEKDCSDSIVKITFSDGSKFELKLER